MTINRDNVKHSLPHTVLFMKNLAAFYSTDNYYIMSKIVQLFSPPPNTDPKWCNRCASINGSKMEDCIWFEEYIACHAESLLNSGAKWLPYGTTAEELYTVSQQKIDSMSTICYQTFLNIWKKCYHVKIKKIRNFSNQ